MNDVQTISIGVTIPQAQIDLANGATRLAQLEETLCKYADGLWEDRGLNATTRVTITLSEETRDTYWREQAPEMTIDGQQARLALPRRKEPALPAAAWGHRLARAIYANRALAGPATASGEGPSLTLSLGRAPSPDLVAALPAVQQRIFERLGLFVPEIRSKYDQRLEEDAFRITVNGRRLPPRAGNTEAVLTALEEEIVGHAPDLLTPSVVADMLDLIYEEHSALVEVVQERALTTTIFDVLRGLLAEEISIANLPAILEGLVAINNTTGRDVREFIVFTPATGVTAYTSTRNTASLDTATVIAATRTHLKMQLSRQYTPLGEMMHCLLLDPSIEKALYDQGVDAYSASEGPALRRAIRDELSYLNQEDVVLLTTIEVRRMLWELIHLELPGLPVLCYQELAPELSLKPLGRVSL